MEMGLSFDRVHKVVEVTLPYTHRRIYLVPNTHLKEINERFQTPSDGVVRLNAVRGASNPWILMGFINTSSLQIHARA